MNRPPSQAVIEAVERAMREHQNLVGPMRRIFGDEVGDALKVLLAQEVQAAAPEVARAAEAAALRASADDYFNSSSGTNARPHARSWLRARADELTDTDRERVQG